MRSTLLALSLLLTGLGGVADATPKYKVVPPKKMTISTHAERRYDSFKADENPIPVLEKIGLATIAREAERLKIEHGAKDFSIQLKGVKMKPTANWNKNAVVKAKVKFFYEDVPAAK